MVTKTAFMQRKKPYLKHPRPAPGEVEILRRFLSSGAHGKHREELSSPENLGRWLAGCGLVSAETEVSEEDYRRVLALRTALHGLVKSRASVPEGLLERLEEASAGVGFTIAFDSHGRPRYVPRPGEPGEAPASLLALFDRIRRDERHWSRLKVCGNCGTVFYDISRRQNGKWCRSACGARVRGIKMKNRRRRRTR